jgi:hypothetical protein
MTAAQKESALLTLVNAMPHDVLHHLVQVPNPTSILPWCVCGHCKLMIRQRMNLCCGHQRCLTTTPTFYNVCARADVIEIANILNWAHQFNDVPSYENNIFRNQAYRNFVLWQWGKLGRGNRRVVSSCVVLAVRRRFPSDHYTDYESSEEF